MDNTTILIISDLQAPYNHPDVLDYLKEIKQQIKPTRVINIGDLADFHRLNFHGANPNLPSAVDELFELRHFVMKLGKLFPKMEIVASNHDDLPKRKARSVGIPDQMLKDPAAIMEAPEGWKYVNEIVTKLPNGLYCKFKHNFGSNLLVDSMKQSMSLVCGHLHSRSNINWWQNDMGMNFAMQVGCLIDDESPAFDYNKGQALRPVMSCGVIKNGIPIILPMYLNKSKKWKGYL